MRHLLPFPAPRYVSAKLGQCPLNLYAREVGYFAK